MAKSIKTLRKKKTKNKRKERFEYGDLKQWSKHPNGEVGGWLG